LTQYRSNNVEIIKTLIQPLTSKFWLCWKCICKICSILFNCFFSVHCHRKYIKSWIAYRMENGTVNHCQLLL